jgi:hypothetical protein
MLLSYSFNRFSFKLFCKYTRNNTFHEIGHIGAVTEEIYAITTERRLTHPVVKAIVQATSDLFS